jgi:hypothetical protein
VIFHACPTFFLKFSCGVVQVWRSCSICILFDGGVPRYFFWNIQDPGS